MKKVLLIGDSIRVGYDKYVKMAFDNMAEIYYPQENCRFTTYIIRHIQLWLEECQCKGEDIDLIHWNAGLWDDLLMLDGEPLVDIEQYKNNIERICKLIKMLLPNAKMVFATSTPVKEELFGDYKRYNKHTEKYNSAAIEIVNKYGGKVDDLYKLMLEKAKDCYSDMTHFYTKEGTKIITEQVVLCIKNELGIDSIELNYDELFKENEQVIGI